MSKLDKSVLSTPPSRVALPSYPRETVTAGIAHLSVGNFHRAHQAVYLDRLLRDEDQRQWGLVGIGVVDNATERAKAQAMHEQDGLYTLTTCPPDTEPQVQIVGSIIEYLFAPDDRAGAIARLTDPAIKIVSLTVTEGGYNIDEHGRFMLDAPAIVDDLQRAVPETVFGMVTEALRVRRDKGVGPFTVLSCDNLRHNGRVARTAFTTYANARDAELGAWIEANVSFPNAMVDRITPATSADDVLRLDAASGFEDHVPVFCEDFIQWVIEDTFCAGRPALERVGVQFTSDVDPYEQVKLRMLNASHSMIAYPALLMGYRIMCDAMRSDDMIAYIEQFLAYDAEPLLTAPPGISINEYGHLLLQRFRNPAIQDQLERIASDGASKLPTFLRDTAEGVLAKGGDMRRIAFEIACFVRHLGGKDDSGESFRVTEPHLSDEDRVLAADPDPARALEMSAFAGWGLSDAPAFVELFTKTRSGVETQGARAVLKTILQAR
ncbi:NADPH-dependent L-sorbose reductase [Ameyamaea chiangmaiensis NBRC 103196]|uniref:Mannitol dehydrogenase family protein n=1 Tax=Ameyamaea chiangmaiensis TaxID=442969 RepID=A0A850P929_9PROT|nr:mannitol dehydrogenase family protein [Ameyamaea chiangmaiensis]MBS4074053.1 mannitol dehydrogenase family protein [Ameyamaea chiangmaiensis]NVN41087.1 mannitol dehydrogenase family protein [Ameyamaea chiangmaiensis]GBQ67424.1 NADPH-dependent L-sorbose reductase [Ameyamaea chiangmaiensis NBRC 103196]